MRHVRGSALRRALALFLALALLAGACNRGDEKPPLVSGPLVIVAAADAAPWLRLLRADGIATRIGTLDEALDRQAAVIPSEVDLVGSQLAAIESWLRRGGKLVTAHEDVLRHLGYLRESRERAPGTVDFDGLGAATWPEGAKAAGLRSGKGGPSDFTSIGRGAGLTMQALAAHGEGRVVALAADPFREDRAGYELYPWLGRQVRAITGAPEGPRRVGTEVYYDPGSLRGTPVEIADLVGDVRAVHVAGWNFDFNDPTDDFDYDGLIAALHAKGVLVYAWLEPPFVTLRFWDDHPQCRERTSTGREAQVDWRKLIALEDPACFTQAWEVWSRLLTAHDWDGVNVAELYFEPDIRAEDFTPFHPSALRRFRGDPAKQPERFLDFRTDLVVELNDQFLRALNGLPNGAELDFQLTVIDDRLDPDLARRVGSDVGRLAAVAEANGASLQVEDPFTQWSRGPLRYEGLADQVSGLLPPGQAFIDVNVVDRADARPTSKMTGGELALAAMAAGRTGRLAVYSAGTVAPADLTRIPAALAGSAEVFDTGTKAPWTILATAPDDAVAGRLDVDGQPWPASSGVAVIPPGEHRLAWSAGPARGPGLRNLTAEIGSASVAEDRLTFAYDARVRPLATIDRTALSLTIDGEPAELEVVPGTRGRVVRLPAGSHVAVITTR